MSLGDSIWATKKAFATRPQLSSTAPKPSLQTELVNYSRLINRIRWKSDLLATSRTNAILHDRQQGGHFATAQFGLDFFEYYTLLEHALVLALALVGVSVPRRTALPPSPPGSSSPTGNTANANRPIFQTGGKIDARALAPTTSSTTTNPVMDGRNRGSAHRFHANLLEALARNSCPLHGTLGTGGAYACLKQAKDFRNQWKEADALPGDGLELGPATDEVSQVTHLEELQLESMTRTIVEALEKGGAVIETRIGEMTDGEKGMAMDVDEAMRKDHGFRDDDGDMVDASPIEVRYVSW